MALYGLKQAPRAWYDRLTQYLVSHGFIRGKADQTLFIKREDGELIVAKVYIDDIIFGSTKDELRDEYDCRVDSLPWIVDLSTRFRYIPISI